MISLNDYLSASGSYPERVNSPELTPELLQNAENLLERVNALLADLTIKTVKVSSGFRPTSVNASIKNAAAKSRHCTCNAVDIMDDGNQLLGKLLLHNAHLLRKHDLFMENLTSTVGKYTNWVHLQYSPNMKDRASRTFLP